MSEPVSGYTQCHFLPRTSQEASVYVNLTCRSPAVLWGCRRESCPRPSETSRPVYTVGMWVFLPLGWPVWRGSLSSFQQ